MTKKEKFKIIINLFYNKVCIGARFILPVSTNIFDQYSDKVYESGYIRHEKKYTVITKEKVIEVKSVFLEEGLESKDRVSIQSTSEININKWGKKFFVNYDIMDLKGKRIK